MIHDSDKDKDDFDEFEDCDEFEDFDDGFDDDFETDDDSPDLPPAEADIMPDDDWDEFEEDVENDASPTTKSGNSKKLGKNNLLIAGAVAGFAILAGGGYYLMQPATPNVGLPPVATDQGTQDQIADTSTSGSSIPLPSPISNLDEPLEEEYIPDYQATLEQELEEISDSGRDTEFMTTETLRNQQMNAPIEQPEEQQFLTPVPDPVLSPDTNDLEPLEEEIAEAPSQAEPLEPSNPAAEAETIDEVASPASTDDAFDIAADTGVESSDDLAFENGTNVTSGTVEDMPPLLGDDEDMPVISDVTETPERLDDPDEQVMEIEPSLPSFAENNSTETDINTIEESSDLPALSEANDKISELEATIAALEANIENLEDNIRDLQENKPTDQNERGSTPSSKKITAKDVAQPAQKPRTETKKPALQVRKSAPVSANIWTMRSAQPGRAVLFNKNTSDLVTIETGKTLSGLGRIEFIGLENGKWVVKGSRGNVHQ